MAHSDAIPIIENLLPEFARFLINEDKKITGLIAQTNCYSWDLENFDNLRAWFQGKGKIEFTVTLYLGGDQDEDQPWSGSEITTRVQATASTPENNSTWKIAEYKVLEANTDL